MLYCTNCNEKIIEGAHFCSQCGGTEFIDGAPTKESKQTDLMREAMCAYIRHIPELTRGEISPLENIDRNDSGQLYGELTVNYKDRFGDKRTARFCAVAEELSDSGCRLSKNSPQRMADFAKPYLAKRALGFK